MYFVGLRIRFSSWQKSDFILTLRFSFERISSIKYILRFLFTPFEYFNLFGTIYWTIFNHDSQLMFDCNCFWCSVSIWDSFPLFRTERPALLWAHCYIFACKWMESVFVCAQLIDTKWKFTVYMHILMDCMQTVGILNRYFFRFHSTELLSFFDEKNNKKNIAFGGWVKIQYFCVTFFLTIGHYKPFLTESLVGFAIWFIPTNNWFKWFCYSSSNNNQKPQSHTHS